MTSEIANLPKGWVRTNLSAIAEVIRGVSFPKDQKSSLPQEGFLGCLRTTNVQREVEWNDMLFVPRRFIRKQEQLVRLNDILISTANSLELVGKVALIRAVPFVTTIGAFIAIIRVHPDINPKFVYFQITSSDIQSYFRQKASTTTNISNISTSNVLNSLLRILPLPEQHRIVAKIEDVFTRLDAGVEALTKIKAQLKRYRQSVLKHAFQGELTKEWRQAHKHELEPASVLLECIREERKKDPKRKYKELPPLDTSNLPQLPEGWVWSNFEELKKAEKNAIKAGPFGSSLKKESCVPHGYKIYGQEQVIRQNPYYGNYYIGEEKYVELKSCAVKPGDILVSLVGTIGKVLILPEDSEPGIINPRLVKLGLEGRLVNSKYIKAYLESSAVRDFFTLASHGETMEILNLSILRTLPIPLPSLHEQHKIVEGIEQCLSVAGEIEKTVDHSLKQADRLRQSILKCAFEGKLVPQDPNDEPAEKLLERIKEERAKRLFEDHSRRENRTRTAIKQMRLV